MARSKERITLGLVIGINHVSGHSQVRYPRPLFPPRANNTKIQAATHLPLDSIKDQSRHEALENDISITREPKKTIRYQSYVLNSQVYLSLAPFCPGSHASYAATWSIPQGGSRSRTGENRWTYTTRDTSRRQSDQNDCSKTRNLLSRYEVGLAPLGFRGGLQTVSPEASPLSTTSVMGAAILCNNFNTALWFVSMSPRLRCTKSSSLRMSPCCRICSRT